MLPVGFETTISAGERPQTYALDRAATGTGYSVIFGFYKYREHNTQSPNKAPSGIYSIVKRFRKRISEVPFCARNDLQQ